MCIAAVIVLISSTAPAENPAYYLKKATWQKTMWASRQALVGFQAGEKVEQCKRIAELHIELGTWYHIGPFNSPNKDPYGVVFGPEQDLDLNKTYVNGRLKWTQMADWKDAVIHPLSGNAGSGQGKVVADYMFRNIKAGKAVTLPIYLGSNDGIHLWLNGEPLLAKDIGRTCAPDQDVVKLNLKPGDNKLLIKVNNRAAAHEFYFSIYPSGGIIATRAAELWNFLRRDFHDEKFLRQMRWERQDNIWPVTGGPADFDTLAANYAKATKAIGKLPQLTAALVNSVRSDRQLAKLRRLYYRSRRFDEQMTILKSKIAMVTDQLAYLEKRFSEKKDNLKWKNYKAKLQMLTERANAVLAQAGQGVSGAYRKLKKLESELDQLHKSQLPQVPMPANIPACKPFDLKRVRLLDSPFKRAMELDRKYLYELDSDRLLHMFRITAGLPSSARQLGGWEKRGVRGHTMGHYLSACAMMYAGTGDEKLKAKADAIVAGLAKVQDAFGNGYLSAFPEEGIKGVIYGTAGWWAPWYTMHKIFAGLIDMYNYCGNEQALNIAVKLAAWARSHLDNLTREQTQKMLEAEFGGMNEALSNLYAITKNPDHLALAKKFDHDAVFEPLANFQDKLTGLHANTQIPKIIGAAREYEVTHEQYYYNIATFFWDTVVNGRSYCTGGTSNAELWRTEPGKLAGQLSATTQETCCTYNMLKLTRHLLCWSADAKYGDFYERTLYNSILSTQDPKTGMMMYHVPLASGYWKVYNTPFNSFWCCTGTGLENHAKYGNTIYFHDDNALYVNLFIASQLDWLEKGATIRQETGFPHQQGTTLVINTKKPTELAIHIRVPYWATKGVTIKINGDIQKVQARPRSFVTLRRSWKNGDRIEVEMPMSLYLWPMPDDASLAAIMYGPLVLAGDLGSDGIDPRTIYTDSQTVLRNYKVPPAPTFTADANNLESWIKPVPGKSLEFRTEGAGRPADVTLIPYYELFGKRYAIYWRINKPAM